MWFPTALSTVFFYGRKIKKNLDNSGVGGMLLTDLSKVFGCLRNDLLISKPVAYGFY